MAKGTKALTPEQQAEKERLESEIERQERSGQFNTPHHQLLANLLGLAQPVQVPADTETKEEQE